MSSRYLAEYIKASAVVQSATADVTLSVSTAAGDTAVKGVTAPLTISPGTAASDTAVKGVTAPVTISPTTTAQGGQVLSAQANLTITPATAAGATRVVGATADVTITPVTDGQDAGVRPAQGDLAITPGVDSTVLAIKGAFADLTIGLATASDAATVAGGAVANLTITVVTTASADIPPPMYFTPPSYPTQVWLSHNTAYTVIVTGSHVDQIVSPGNKQIAGADYVYVGGHRYTVSLSEAQTLHAAGYTVENYTPPPGFGLGPFGTGPFGGTG